MILSRYTFCVTFTRVTCAKAVQTASFATNLRSTRILLWRGCGLRDFGISSRRRRESVTNCWLGCTSLNLRFSSLQKDAAIIWRQLIRCFLSAEAFGGKYGSLPFRGGGRAWRKE